LFIREKATLMVLSSLSSNKIEFNLLDI